MSIAEVEYLPLPPTKKYPAVTLSESICEGEGEQMIPPCVGVFPQRYTNAEIHLSGDISVFCRSPTGEPGRWVAYPPEWLRPIADAMLKYADEKGL